MPSCVGHVPYNPRPPHLAPHRPLEIQEEPLEVEDEPLGVVEESRSSGALPSRAKESRSSSTLRLIPWHPRLVSHNSLYREVSGRLQEGVETLFGDCFTSLGVMLRMYVMLQRRLAGV